MTRTSVPLRYRCDGSKVCAAAVRAAALCAFVLLFTARCDAGPAVELDGDAAEAMIRRNLGVDQAASVSDARVLQYGSIHLDGPSGGVLYRFDTTREVIDRLCTSLPLTEGPFSTRDYPSDFPSERPRWWSPDESDGVLRGSWSLESGGRKEMLLFAETEAGRVWIVEHYSDQPGI